MFKNITLEISLKPFKKTTEEYIRSVCQKVFEQWKPLIKNREIISIMMWSSDGSELLDYTGDLDKEFEWCCYVGTANKPLVGDMPPETSPHKRKQLYMENPPRMTYRILKTIVDTFKEEGKKYFPSSEIRVGTTFDIGPEFAISDFKYNRHREICNGTGCDQFGFVDATALLDGDTYPYAAYPDGIPDKTPMGTFLGAQANVFLRDMGFDFIWLSNGMGFCYEPWNKLGKIYDGEEFHTDKLPATREKVFLFWKLFRDACPDYHIATRGTNYSAAIDYASDGVPLYDIYKGNFNITPPPNSPWAAISDDFGIEILGHLTRNCINPGEDYMFRFYLHDIWWMNSPWYDRYESSPHDIYIPMALSRINEQGKVHTPSLFNILSVDNSKGDMPDNCAYEAIPHMLKAEKNAPDEPSPLVLVYPLKEYTTATDKESLREMYFCDTFMQNAINHSFPLATVVATDNFVKNSLDIYKKSILVVPAAIYNEEAEKKLAEYANRGGKIIVFGSRNALDKITYPAKKVDIYGSTDKLFEALDEFNYSIKFVSEEPTLLPILTLHRHDNSMMFSVYSRDTSLETRLKFPLGAPVLNGFSTKLKDGYATYHFHKSVHAECRVFVKQEGGIVKAKEEPPVNMKYRRRIEVSGLKNATVYIFPEDYCKEDCIVTNLVPDLTPVPLEGWSVAHDKENGTYLYAENVSGSVAICMPVK